MACRVLGLLRYNSFGSALWPTDAQGNAIGDDDGQDRDRRIVALVTRLRSMIHSSHAFSDRKRRSILEPFPTLAHILAYSCTRLLRRPAIAKGAAGAPRDG